jgi:DNA (cytosine-5)-methyltransferase 1
VAHSLRGEGFDASEDGTGRGTPLVPHVVGALACNTGPNGHDAGNFACNPAVDAGHVLPVAVAFHQTQDPISSTDGSTHALGCGSTGGQASVAVAQPVMYAIQAGALRVNPASGPNGVGVQADHAYTLEARAEVQAVAFAENSRAELRLEGGDGSRCGALSTGGGKPGQGVPMVATTARVRRITPLEAERLMGFPDNYTAIPWRKKPASECPDCPRYKALGNSMAVPCMRWIGQRIQSTINHR